MVAVAVKAEVMVTVAAAVVEAQVAHKAHALKVMVVHARKVKVRALTAPTTHRATLVMSQVIHRPHASIRWRPTPSAVMVNRVAPKTTPPAVSLTRCAPAWI
jgi:hypothetical protein